MSQAPGEMGNVSDFDDAPKQSWIEWLRAVRPMTWVKIGLLLLVVIGIILFLIFAPVVSWLTDFLEFVDSIEPWGEILLAEVYIACTILFIPGSILTLGAGLAFGVPKGVITVSIASTIGATAAFLYGNTLLRSWVEKKVSHTRIFGSIDRAITNRGWVIVFLLRLSPVIPFNLLNYALGLTSVGVIPYLLASWIGMLPATVVYVYIGSTAKAFTELSSGGMTTGKLILYIVGFIATVLALVLLTWFAKREIQKAMVQVDGEEEDGVRGIARQDTYGGVVNSVSIATPEVLDE